MRIFEEMRKIQKEIRDGLVAKSEINIFISYSSRDKEYADRISSALQNWGHDIWIDRIEMEIGKPDSEIEDILKKNIKKADCLLVLLSKNSIKSRWVKIEYEEAIRRERIDSEIVVLPAIIDDCEIPEDLLKKKHIDFRKNFDGAISDIISHYRIRIARRREESFVASWPYHGNLGGTTNTTAVVAYNQGNLLFQEGNTEGAIAKWNLAVKLDPDFTDALYNSAVALYELAMQNKGKSDYEYMLKRAIDCYELLLKKSKDDVDAMVNLSTAYRVSKSYRNIERERQLLEEAYRKTPNYGLVWFNWAYFHLKEGGIEGIVAIQKGQLEETTIDLRKLELAKKCFTKAMQLDPNLEVKFGISEFVREIDELINIAKKYS